MPDAAVARNSNSSVSQGPPSVACGMRHAAYGIGRWARPVFDMSARKETELPSCLSRDLRFDWPQQMRRNGSSRASQGKAQRGSDPWRTNLAPPDTHTQTNTLSVVRGGAALGVLRVSGGAADAAF